MANDEHVALFERGTKIWNEWREQNPNITPDLSGASLEADHFEANLRGVNLSRANLSHRFLAAANLTEAKLTKSDLTEANLSEANLTKANLYDANLYCANLAFTNLTEASLIGANLTEADLRGANLTEASLGVANLTTALLDDTNFAGALFSKTIFGDLDLSGATGLDSCGHLGPSIIDVDTLLRSRHLPLSFLRGCGLPDKVIEYLPSLRGEAIQFYSCFISYSANNQVFAKTLHADMQDRGVRCWFAPHDLPIGAKTWNAIDEAIRLKDKLLLILSKASIASDWVEDEVNKAYAEERSRKEVVLFPIRIDNTVMSTAEPWAVKLRDQRNIGDFRQWRRPAEYQKSLERLLRDLKASGGK
jgi:hypothetical protein